jgi:hypothetical protein
MPEQQPEPDEFGRYRVTDKETGHKSSVTASQLPHGNYTILKAPASNPLTGEPLPPELNAVKPTANPSGQSAENPKE